MDFNLTRELRIDFEKTRSLLTPRVWRVYKKYPYFAEFFDMVWLRHQLWPVLRSRSLIFDSYNCMRPAELGAGQPWPTRQAANTVKLQTQPSNPS